MMDDFKIITSDSRKSVVKYESAKSFSLGLFGFLQQNKPNHFADEMFRRSHFTKYNQQDYSFFNLRSDSGDLSNILNRVVLIDVD